jgi:hypothetical protein
VLNACTCSTVKLWDVFTTVEDSGKSSSSSSPPSTSPFWVVSIEFDSSRVGLSLFEAFFFFLLLFFLEATRPRSAAHVHHKGLCMVHRPGAASVGDIIVESATSMGDHETLDLDSGGG